MEIENDRILCAVAWRQPDYLECYRVDGILALRDLSSEQAIKMTGHPGNDLLLLPDGNRYAFAFRVRPTTLARVESWTRAGLFVAVYITTYRNKAGQPRAYQPDLTWRKPEKYLTPEDMAWLRAYSESSYWYTEQLAVAVSRVMAGIGQAAEQMVIKRQPKNKPRIKAKERRLTRKENYENEWNNSHSETNHAR